MTQTEMPGNAWSPMLAMHLCHGHVTDLLSIHVVHNFYWYFNITNDDRCWNMGVEDDTAYHNLASCGLMLAVAKVWMTNYHVTTKVSMTTSKVVTTLYDNIQ